MKIQSKKVLDRANQIYLQRKINKGVIKKDDLLYLAPELLPQIKSDQVVAILEALVEAVNKESH